MRIICNAIIFISCLLASKAAYSGERFLFADKVDYNAEEAYAEAIGHVRIVLNKYVIYADKIFYDIEKDEVWAHGNIRAFSGDAEIAIGEAALLTDHAKHMVISSFILYFKTSDAVIAAALAKRSSNGNASLTRATFTSCPTCKTSKPLWQISAQKANILKDKYKIVYKNMFFQIYGVPVAFFPYFSHPLPGAPAKSGILMPDITGKKLGIPIYFRPKSNIDGTFTPRSTRKSFLYEGEFRHLLKNGSYIFNGSITSTKQNVTMEKDGKVISKKKMNRFHLSGDGHFVSNDIHYGFNLNRVSDLGFLAQYYQRNDPFLVSNIYGYKVDKGNYLEVNNLSLQGLSANDSSFTDPTIVPEINFRYLVPLPEMGDARLRIDNYTSVYSTDALGKITRTIWEIDFANSHITDTGHVLGVELYNRSDLYHVDIDNYYKHKQYTTGRSIPELRMSVRYPWIGNLGNNSLIVEPITLLAFGKKHISDPKKFHFIDSNEYDFDDTNFLQYNRYNGYDFHEYGNRVTYGAKSVLDNHNGYKIGMFLGQSQKLSDAAVSKSDIVGKAYMNLRDQLELYYRFSKNTKHFGSVFDELGMWYNEGDITLNGGFISLHHVHMNNINKIRQIYFDSGYDYNEQWNFGFGSRIDMSKSKPKQLSRSIRVTYKGDCVSISSTISKNFTSDSSRAIKKTDDYSFAIRLKTLNM